MAALATAAPAAAQTSLPDPAAFVERNLVRSVRLSPDGRHAAYIRAFEEGEQLIVADIAARTATAISRVNYENGMFNWLAWKNDERLIVSVRVGIRAQIYGIEAQLPVTRVMAMNRDGGAVVTMFENQMRRLSYGLGSTFLIDLLRAEPDHVLLAAWDNMGTGVWRADVGTGRVQRVADGDFDTIGYATDGSGYPVMRMDARQNRSGFRFYRRAPGARSWTLALDARRDALMTNSPDFQPVASGPGPGELYVLARPAETDLLGLYLYNTATGELGAPLQTPSSADAAPPWLNRRTNELLATCEFAQRLICEASDRQIQRHLDGVGAFFMGAATVTLADMSGDGMTWLLHVEGPTDPPAYYLYDRDQRRVEMLAQLHPQLTPEDLSPTEIVTYRSRDGTTLWAYVTARPGAGPRPTIILPHGGPEARDFYGYDPFVQFLVSRGYVVVQPNFRGSQGFGRSFADAGRGQWGLRMQDDVTDALTHMIEARVADPQRVCIVGMSYGGYSALAGAAFTPELYRCAVSVAGVSDLPEMLRSERQSNGRGSIDYHYWLRSIGDPRQDREALMAASPARRAAAIRIPVLLLHGENDYVVEIEQSEMMDRALRESGGDVRFVRYPDADHYWDAWEAEKQVALLREVETFLAQHLQPRQ